MTKKEEIGKKKEGFHWADGVAEQLIKERPKKPNEEYVVAAGVTPSGTVHIGNFREVITCALVTRALKDKGKKVRFIYSWDDYDKLRKIPKNLPKQKLEKYLNKPTISTPDPFGCHKNYAQHFEKEFEKSLHVVSIFPEFIYQSEMYRTCKYAEQIKFVLQKKDEIRKILDKYRKEPLDKEWMPLVIYCEKCGKDTCRIKSYDNYEITYECECGYSNSIDFRKRGIVKLPWRIDWPMRKAYEKVDFEPAGKEHATPGGSWTTAKELLEMVWKTKPNIFLAYDFIILKGIGGKMSGSLGNVITLGNCLEIYEPQILRYLFASTKPNKEFAISFDGDVIKIYADFDKLEQDYFDKKLDKKQKRIYELSITKKPEKVFAAPFRQLIELVQSRKPEEIIAFYKKQGGIKSKEDKERTEKRSVLAKNWLKYAPKEFLFKIQEKINKEKIKSIKEGYRKSLKKLVAQIKKVETENEIIRKIKEIIEKNNLDTKEFFRVAYLIILGKEKGPRLSSIIMLEKEKIIKLLKQL